MRNRDEFRALVEERHALQLEAVRRAKHRRKRLLQAGSMLAVCLMILAPAVGVLSHLTGTYDGGVVTALPPSNGEYYGNGGGTDSTPPSWNLPPYETGATLPPGNGPTYGTGAVPPEGDNPPEDTAYSFDSYGELAAFFLHYVPFGENRVGLDTWAQEIAVNGSVPVPAEGGSAAPLQDRGITLFTSELYDLPWIWYHCRLDGNMVTASITSLPAAGVDDIALTGAQAVRALSPDAPNLDTWKNYAAYTAACEREISVNGNARTALVLETAADTYVQFVWEGLLISLRGDADLQNTGILDDLEITHFPLY